MHEGQLSLEELKLLQALDQKKSLSDVSIQMHRDKSVLSRRLKQISEKSFALEKVGTRWRLTEVGKRLSKLAFEFEEEQKRIMGEPTTLNIAATRMFASNFLARRLGELQAALPGHRFVLLSQEGSPERALLSGNAEIAFACGRPNDPEVAFKRGIREPFYFVASPKLGVTLDNVDALKTKPHMLFRAADGTFPLRKHMTSETPLYAASNDPLVLLEAVRAGLAWTVLPYYAVEKELKTGALIAYGDAIAETETYGVWWLKSRKNLYATAQKTFAWLRNQRLEP